jgi:IrrE N-terminal-like domain
VQLLWEAISELDRVVELPPVRLPDCAGLDPAAAARTVRRDWGIESGPVVHLARTLEYHGVVVAHLEQPGVGPCSVSLSGRPIIVLTTWEDPRHRRFTLARELGRLLLYSRNEPEADAFAAELLMPAAEFADRRPDAADWFGVTPSAVADRARSLGLPRVTRTVAAHRDFPGEEPELLHRAAELAARLGTRPTLLRDLLGPRLRVLS